MPMQSSKPVREGRRVLICGLAGSAAGVAAAFVADWELAVLVGWLVTSGALLCWIWSAVHDLDAAATEQVATREDDSRTAARALIVVASVVSLAAVIVGLNRAAAVGGSARVVLTVAAMTTVATSWLTVHTVFVLRYAHLFYAGRAGGIDFPGGQRPDYRDFAYVGFTIGMTFQVSDTAVDDVVVRRTVFRHALLSYLFGTAIVATTINVLAGLVG
jgi:uncharacterized membrane protein